MRQAKFLGVIFTLFITSGKADNVTEYNNITGGNTLWDGILRDCKSFPSMSCIQKNVYHYLDDTLDNPGDVDVGQFMRFKPNKVDYTKYTKEANEPEAEEGEARSSPLEEVTNALSNKGSKFLMTHDMEIKLPSFMEGATFKMSPRGYEGDGVLVKLDLIQTEEEGRAKEDGMQPRIFFKQIAKGIFKKFFKNKLVTAFLSLLLVLKMLKVKFLFIAPILLGVGTAKKILLKVLLFLFPALTHLFKLCSYYHQNYHQTKYHHHHHQIAHVHHPPSLHHHGASIHHAPEIHVSPHHGYFQHETPEYEFSGPGLGPEYISNRNSYDASGKHTPGKQTPGQHTPSSADENEIKSWGLGQGHKEGKRGQPKFGQPMTKAQIEQLALQAEKDAIYRIRLQQEQAKLRQENIRLQEQLKQELKIHEQLKLQAMSLGQNKQKIPTQQQSPPRSDYDPFYSPILQRIDTILNGLGFRDEPCRERLICSMYKNPGKFSPHSNLVSAELSRDSKELVKPTSSNEAVVRFYRYVQAARDGQDQRECLRLYASCAVNTE